MFLDEIVKTTISNQGQYYKNLGYENIKQGLILYVPIKHLPKNSNMMVKCKCDDCEMTFERQFQLLNRTEIHRCFDCTRKFIGTYVDTTKASAKNKLRTGTKHPRWRKDKTEFQDYFREVTRITEHNYKKFKDEINPNDHPRTLCGIDGGYQLDHIISITEGFEKNMKPSKIGSKSNLRMLTWRDNLARRNCKRTTK